MRLTFALDLRYRRETIVEPAVSHELSDNASARKRAKALIRADACCRQRGQSTQTLDAVVVASVALPLHVRVRWVGYGREEVLNPQTKALCPDIAQAFGVLCCKFCIETLRAVTH